MRLVAEFEITCDALPLVEVAATVPEATILLELQFNHGDRPLFLVTVTGGSHQQFARALTDAYDVGDWTLVGRAGDTRRYQVVPALSFEEQLGDHIEDLADIPEQQLDEIEEFFETYKNLEAGKEVETLGFEDRQAAYDAIEHAQELYAEHFG